MRGYVVLLVPTILVVVAATDVPPTYTPHSVTPTQVMSVSTVPHDVVVVAATDVPSTYVTHPADVTPTPVMSVSTVSHDVPTLSHVIQTTRPETTAGAAHHALPVPTLSHVIQTTRPETTAGAAHHALPVTLPHLFHTTRPETTAGAAHHALPGHSIVTTSRTTHGETGHSEVTTSRDQHGDTDTPAKPEIRLGITENGIIVTCFSASKIPNIRYELIQDSKVVQNMTVHTNQPANFTIHPPGEMQLQCLARSLSGMETFSIVQNVSVDKGNRDPKLQRGVSVLPLDAVVKVNETEVTDGEETDASLEVRKNRGDSLADVFQAVEHFSILILCICGPTILFILLVVIYVTHLRNRRERKLALIKHL